MTKENRHLVWSSGGGVQSTAIAVLIAKGEIPTPECVVMADTGREASETWEYNRLHVAPLMASVGLEVEVAPHSLSKYDLYSKDLCMIPAYVFYGGEAFGHPEKFGRLPTFCSGEWKRDVVLRYLSGKGYGPKKPIRQYMGFSTDEARRAKGGRRKWAEWTYPLIELGMNRHDCVDVVLKAGLPTPPRSSCWMCPHRKNAEWRRLRESYKDEWEMACKLDEEIRQRDPKHGVFLHRDRKPLRECNIDLDGAACGESCESGLCFV
jgi:hypothetical protein